MKNYDYLLTVFALVMAVIINNNQQSEINLLRDRLESVERISRGSKPVHWTWDAEEDRPLTVDEVRKIEGTSEFVIHLLKSCPK